MSREWTGVKLGGYGGARARIWALGFGADKIQDVSGVDWEVPGGGWEVPGVGEGWSGCMFASEEAVPGACSRSSGCTGAAQIWYSGNQIRALGVWRGQIQEIPGVTWGVPGEGAGLDPGNSRERSAVALAVGATGLQGFCGDYAGFSWVGIGALGSVWGFWGRRRDLSASPGQMRQVGDGRLVFAWFALESRFLPFAQADAAARPMDLCFGWALLGSSWTFPGTS